MKNLDRLGMYMYLIPLIVFGVLHFVNADAMSGMVPSYIPGGVIWVYITGTALIIASLAVIIGKKAKLALQLLGLMILLFAFILHFKNALTGDMSMFLKDFAIAGSAWWASRRFDN